MAIIKLTPTRPKQGSPYHSYNYSNESARENLVNYIWSEDKIPHHLTGFRNLPQQIQMIPLSMKAICNLYQQEKIGKRKAEHFEISLSKNESALLGLEGLRNISEQYCDAFSEDYQIAYAIHENKPDQLHAHFIINPVHLKNGTRLHKDRKFLYRQRELVSQLCNKEIEQTASHA